RRAWCQPCERRNTLTIVFQRTKEFEDGTAQEFWKRQEIWQGRGQNRGQRDATQEGRDPEVGPGRQGRHGQEPEASDRDRTFGGPQEGGKSALEKLINGGNWEGGMKPPR